MRTTSTTFDYKLEDLPVEFDEFKEIKYLVKSSSRFFLKPDIGEVLDQIDFFDYHKVTGVCLDTRHDLLPNTDEEEFIMYATLLTDKQEEI